MGFYLPSAFLILGFLVSEIGVARKHNCVFETGAWMISGRTDPIGYHRLRANKRSLGQK